MSNSTDALESGRVALVAQAGETLGWIPAASVLKRESGEVLVDENGKAIIGDDTQVEFDAIFEEAYAIVDVGSGSVVSTGPAVTNASPSDLPGCGRGDVVVRNPNTSPEYFFVLEKRVDGLVEVILILSKHAQ